MTSKLADGSESGDRSGAGRPKRSNRDGVGGTPRSGRTQVERSETMRARIIDAAITCLADRGYGATTTILVTKVAGVSRGAMLHHFPTKADLMLAVVERVMDLNHQFYDLRLGEITDPLERFIGLIDARWELANQPHGIALSEIMVGARSDEIVKERYPELIARLRAKQSQRFEARAENAGFTLTGRDHAVARAIVYSIRGMAIERQVNPSLNVEPILEVLRDLRLSTLEGRVEGAGSRKSPRA